MIGGGAQEASRTCQIAENIGAIVLVIAEGIVPDEHPLSVWLQLFGQKCRIYCQKLM